MADWENNLRDDCGRAARAAAAVAVEQAEQVDAGEAARRDVEAGALGVSRAVADGLCTRSTHLVPSKTSSLAFCWCARGCRERNEVGSRRRNSRTAFSILPHFVDSCVRAIDLVTSACSQECSRLSLDYLLVPVSRLLVPSFNRPLLWLPLLRSPSLAKRRLEGPRPSSRPSTGLSTSRA